MASSFPSPWALRATLVTMTLALLACAQDAERAPDSQATQQATPRETPRAPEPSSEANERALEEQAYAQAKAAIAAALAQPALPGAADFERNRAQLVARAKSEPVFFVKRPAPDPETSKGVLAQRRAFERTDFAWRTMKDLRKQFDRNKPALRQLFLTDGYVYSESANHAFTLVSQLKPSTLFDGEPLWIQRGAEVFHAEPDDKGEYAYADGPQAGKRVRLLHLDRVGTGPLPEPLHVDFRELRYRTFFDRVKVRHVSEREIVADLRYGELWVPTLLTRDGAKLRIVHELVESDQMAALTKARDLLRRKTIAHSSLRQAMRAAIDEGLPFDEPKTEFGQEDGKLRNLWRHAYLNGRTSFVFNQDRYQVFGKEGQPLVPQVCIDYMVDTFQRAAGSWWRPKADGVRERTSGKLDFGEVSNEDLRRTQFFVNYARERTDWFEVLHFPEARRVELGYKDSFFAWLAREADNFEAGDIILIRGMTPWDEIDEHTHSFFIYETDPLSGVPIAIAGNAGPANLWSWETEARRTPKRTVRTRIRPKLEWLETFIDTTAELELSPPALISGKK